MQRAKLYGLLSASIFLLISGASLANPDDLNRISGITVTEEADETVILISAEHTPTFSVFKLDEPVRLFVDVSQADASKVSDPVVVDNGVLDQVVGMQIKSNGTPVGRIIIGLRQNAAYDVKATDRGIVVRVDGAGRRPAAEDARKLSAEVEKIKAELAREKDLLEKIRQNREREAGLRLSEEQSRLEAERLRAKAEELKASAESEAREAARIAQEEKVRLEETRKARIAEEKSVAQLNNLKSEESRKLEEARKAREREEKLTGELAAARENNENARAASIQAEIDKARKQKAQADSELADLGKKIESAKTDAAKSADLARQAERLEASVKQEKAELARLTKEREEASKAWSQTVSKLETEEKRLEAIARSRDMAEKEVMALRAEVDNLKNARKAVETDEARRLREEIESRESELKELRARADAAGEAAQTAQIRLDAKEKELGDLKAGLENERAAHETRLAAEKKAAEAEIAAREKEIAQLKAEAKAAKAAAAKADGQLTQSQKDALARLDAKEKELAAAREEARKADESSAARIAAEKAEAQAKLAARENEIAALRADMEAARAAAEQEGRNKAMAEQEEALSSLRAKYEETIADVKETNRRQEETIRDLSEQVESAQDDAQKAQDVASKARDDAQKARDEVAAREKRIAELQTELETLQSNASASESKEVARLQKLVEQKEAEVRRLSKASSDGAKLDEARAELASYKSDMAAARQREKEALDRERAAAERIAQLTEEARRIDQKLGDKQNEVERLKAELAAARESGKVADKQARADADREMARLSKELEAARTAEKKAAKATNAAAQAEIDRLKGELEAARKAVPKAAPTGDTYVKAIDFKTSNQGPSIVLALDGDADYSVTTRDGAYVLTIDGAKLPKELARRLDVTAFGTAVAMVSSFQLESGKIQVVASLDKPVGQNLARQGGKLVWTFSGPASNDLMAGAVPTPRVGPVAAQAAPAAQTAAAARGPTPEMAEDPRTAEQGGYLKPSMVPKKKKYQGRRINLTVKDADIQNVLTFLAREGRVNIVTSEEVRGKVTFHLEDVPWDLALDTVLKAKGLDYVVEQGIYRVASSDSIQKEYEAKVEKAKKQRELKPVVVRLVPVNYGKGEEMATRVKDVLSDKGSVSVDGRTNTLVIKDTEDYLAAAEELVTRLDQQTPQILIEARIVEARTTFSEDIGIQWGGNFSMSSAFGNETGTAFPSSIGLAGGSGEASPSGGISLDNPNWAVNLPAAVGTGSGGAIGIQLGSIGGIGNLTLRLSAAEENGDVKIISSPRISTLDNRKASISQGVQIPISVVSAAGVNTQFFAADLRLDVEPHVTRDGHINLKLDITKNEPDFGNLAANGNPTIQKKEAHTELLIRDGDTTVIGGIYTRSTGKSFKKIPFLGDIPVLGWLFKSRNRSDDRSELLIFITPKVVNREVSL